METAQNLTHLAHEGKRRLSSPEKLSTRRRPVSDRSAIFLFQFRPPRIEVINGLLNLSHLGRNTAKTDCGAHNCGIFGGGTLCAQVLFRLGDALFARDSSILASCSV